MCYNYIMDKMIIILSILAWSTTGIFMMFLMWGLKWGWYSFEKEYCKTLLLAGIIEGPLALPINYLTFFGGRY